MYLQDDNLILSPSDLCGFVGCRYMTQRDVTAALDGLVIEHEPDPMSTLLADKGDEHEQRYLEQLKSDGVDVREITIERGAEGLVAAAEATQAAMRDGAEVIFQATFFDGSWRGHADFVERVETESELGEWSYEAADTKLSRHPKPAHVLQLCAYSEQVERIQGTAPQAMHVLLGDRETTRASFKVADFGAYYRRLKARFEQAVAAGVPGAAPYPVPACGFCRHAEHCEQRWDDEDHLSIVARLSRPNFENLTAAGITNIPELANADDDDRPGAISVATFAKLRSQAALQHGERANGNAQVELLKPEPGRGFALLPEPSPGDLFFDIEGHPLYPGGPLEYLLGVSWVDDNGSEQFTAFTGTTRPAEKRAFEQFMDFVAERRRVHPDLHIYHYAAYESTALKRLMGIHGAREDEVDDLLRQGVLVDLYRVLTQSMRTSKPSYSLKDIEHLYASERTEEVTGGGESIIEFERYLVEQDPKILQAIIDYNEVDCKNTLLLRQWLLERKADAESEFGNEIPWRPTVETDAEPADADRLDDETQALIDALVGATEDEPPTRIAATGALLPLADSSAELDDSEARWLLSMLLDYHRREAKPSWWAYFERLERSPQELADEDSDALGALSPTGAEPVPVKQSLEYELRFDPQEHSIGPGTVFQPVKLDPTIEKDALSLRVTEVSDERGIVKVRRSSGRADEPLPLALIPGGPLETGKQREALRRIGRAVIEQGLTHAGRYQAAKGVLARRRPATGTVELDLDLPEFSIDHALEVALDLDSSYLFIQGPPGSGKTYCGGELIARLIDAGKTVGVAAQSHTAINGLLAETEAAAIRHGIGFTGLKKEGQGGGGYESDLSEPRVVNTDSNEECEESEDPLIAGTAWLMAREGMDSKIDYLVIDEAGQISLADALAMSTCANNLILIGDPQQLAQVSQGAHPPGCRVSVLEHLLAADSTVPPDRGMFMEQTRRMHPDVCRFISEVVYDGRLTSIPECSAQVIGGAAELDGVALTGTGIRWLPAEHEGNTRSSAEEAEIIGRAVRLLLGTDWTNADAETAPLDVDDIVIVTPYNEQVKRIAGQVPEGVRVGTVDKFQGQQAAIAFYSMATSTGEDAPRNLEFLYSRNRLNVAISRARCLAVLVCTPQILETECSGIDQMRLVNATCRFVEMSAASTVSTQMQ